MRSCPLLLEHMLLAMTKLLVKREFQFVGMFRSQHIKEVGDEVGHGIVSQDHCQDIGKKLGITRYQVFTFLLY